MLQARSGSIYWSDFDGGDIRRADLGGTGQSILITGVSKPVGPAVDPGKGKMYWGNTGSGLRRANLDATLKQTLYGGPVGAPSLDPAAAKVYWTDPSGLICRANLDGSAQEILIDGTGQETLIQNLNAPSGIALDVGSGQMYWANYGSGDIRRANLDGAGQVTLITGLSGPGGVALDLSPASLPVIETATHTAGTFSISWSALMGRGYQVQFTPDLAQTNWNNSGGPRTATNTTMTAQSDVGSDPQRFYRVLLLP